VADAGTENSPARVTVPAIPGPGVGVAARGVGQMLAQGHGYRLIETRARGKPALALCREDISADILHASGLLVLAPLLRATTIFGTKRPGRLGLPRTRPSWKDQVAQVPPGPNQISA
jgi:hypothetical protein